LESASTDPLNVGTKEKVHRLANDAGRRLHQLTMVLRPTELLNNGSGIVRPDCLHTSFNGTSAFERRGLALIHRPPVLQPRGPPHVEPSAAALND
jgi:hypothetical protein